MKQLRILFLLIAVFTVNVLAQNNPTFDRSYGSLQYGIIHIEENSDGTFFLYGSDSYDEYVIIKTDSEGQLLWIKESMSGSNDYLFRSFLDKRIIPSENDNLLVLTKNPVEDPNRNVILRDISKTGDILLEKEILNTDSSSGSQIIKLGDGYFILLKRSIWGSTNLWNTIIIKMDQNYNEIWREKTHWGTGNSNLANIVQMNDSLFAFAKKFNIEIIKNSGEIVDTISTESTISMQTINDSILLCGNANILRAYNYFGEQLWEKEGGSVEVVGERIFTRKIDYPSNDFPLFELDLSGEIINQTTFRSRILSVKETNNGEVIIGGATFSPNHTTFTKLENNLEHEGIDLFNTDPFGWSITSGWDSTVVYYSFNQNKIEWYNTAGIDFIDLELSTDNGNSWEEIISYYPADSGKYNWTVPNKLTEEGIIRIKESLTGIYNDEEKIKIRIRQDYDYISINNIKMWLGNNGDGSNNPLTHGSGFFWPAESEKTLTYQDGLVWGLKVNGEIRVNGNTFRQGLRPGIIKEDGTAGDYNDPEYKIYKLRKDWQLLPPSADRDRYEYDYFNWPTENGAPFIDNDNDGIYDPGIDEPEYFGDEMLFYVANDLDSLVTFRAYGSPPIKLEQQCLTYGYDREDELKDVVFKKYTIINKSENDWTEMYLNYWSDDDMGSAGDDYSGCDTLLDLGYTYNGEDQDEMYGIPPAVGHMLLQGPITEAMGDSSVFKGNIKHDYKNIPLTSSITYLKNFNIYNDPLLGNLQGVLEFYNNMQGKGIDGSSIIDPIENDTTTFVLNGDPVSQMGWVEGDMWASGIYGYPPYGRRALISSGPFTLAAGDTQEVVIAILAAQGTDRLNSVTELKNTARKVREFYYGQFITDIEDESDNQPLAFKLEQNYPNPFNPSTKINYSIPLNRTNSNSSVRLIIYDVLGKEVARLVDEKKPPGNYEVVFNASALSSGVYFYRLQYDSFIQTKKMVLLK